MRILQPAEWSKPRGFSHGVEVDGPGKWIVLAGQTGGDDKGELFARHGGPGRHRAEADHQAAGRGGRGPEHIVRLTWYLTSRGEYEAAGSGDRRGLEGNAGAQLSAIDAALHRRAGRRPGQGRNRGHAPSFRSPDPGQTRDASATHLTGKFMTTQRSTSADFVTAFATGWPEHQPDVMVLSLTTHNGVQDFAFNKEQALPIAQDDQGDRANSPKPKRPEIGEVTVTNASPALRGRCQRGGNYFDRLIVAPRNWLSAFNTMCCLLPVVFNEILALNTGRLDGDLQGARSATVWMLPRDIAAGFRSSFR